MAMKPFEIQSADLKLGGVTLQAGTTGVVIPGVTQATSYKVEEVEDTGDQTRTFSQAPTVLDYVLYNAILNQGDVTLYADFTVYIEDDGYIDEIKVNGRGGYTAQEAADAGANDMYAYVGSGDPGARPLDPNDWAQIPFRPKMRAGEVEAIGGGGGASALENLEDVDISDPQDGQALVWDSNDEVWKNQTVSGSGNANTGNFVFEGNSISSPNSGSNVEIYGGEDNEGSSAVNLISRDYAQLNYSSTGQPNAEEGKNNYVWVDQSGVAIQIWADSNNGDYNLNWFFDNTGSLTLPPGGDIKDSNGTSVLGGGGNANTGNVVFDGNSLYVGGTGFLNLDTGSSQASIGTNGPYPLLVSINESDKVWTFNSNGSITFPDNTVQTTAYTGSSSGAGNTLVAGYYSVTLDSSNGYLRTNYDGSDISIIFPRENDLVIDSLAGSVVLSAGDTTEFYFSQSGTLQLPTGGQINFTYGGIRQPDANSDLIVSSGRGIKISTDEDADQWTFDTSGNLTLPAGGDILDSNGSSVLVNNTTKTWTNPNSNTWRIEEYSDGWAGGYDYPIAEMSYTLVESQTDVNYFFIDTSAYPEQWQAIQWADEYVINGVTVNASGYGVTSFPGYNVSLGGNVTYSSGDTVTIRYRNRNENPEAQVWWDAANSPSGNSDFRGAIIEYHAYCGNSGTAVGKIIIACDNNMAVSHEETMVGSDMAQYEFWMQGETGQLKVRRVGTDSDNNDDQIWIQWTGKIFYGSDYYC